jgi:hypothetical protein
MIRPIFSTQKNRVTVDFFTSSYRFSATLVINKGQLLTVLGDNMTSYLDLQDIYASRVSNPSEIFAVYPKGTVPKDEINFILLSDETQGTPSGQPHGPGPTLTIPVLMIIASFEIQGVLQWKGPLDPKKFLAPGGHKYLAVSQAIATHSYFPKTTFQGVVGLVNKSKVELLCFNQDSSAGA